MNLCLSFKVNSLSQIFKGLSNKALNILQLQTVDGLVDEGGHIRFYVSGYLLQPQSLERLLDFGEAALNAI